MSEQLRGASQHEMLYGISTANVLDKATLQLALGWRIEDHVKTARMSGLSGIEIWPTRPIIAVQGATGLITEEARNAILSTHQSPRAETVFSAIASKSPQLVAATLLLPPLDTSLNQLENIHRYVGRDIPAVMYKESPIEFHRQTHITRRIIQPDPEVCRDWDVKSARDFVEKMKIHGFTGICLDITHIRRGGQDGSARSILANWREALPVFLEEQAITEVHVALGRTDPDTAKAVGRENTLHELKDLLDGTSKTEAVKMLHTLANRGWRGQVIFEVLPTAILEVTGSQKRFLTQKDLVAVYETMRESLYQIFDN